MHVCVCVYLKKKSIANVIWGINQNEIDVGGCAIYNSVWQMLNTPN